MRRFLSVGTKVLTTLFTPFPFRVGPTLTSPTTSKISSSLLPIYTPQFHLPSGLNHKPNNTQSSAPLSEFPNLTSGLFSPHTQNTNTPRAQKEIQKKKNHKHTMVREITNTTTTTIKFLCSYGGKILPRSTDGLLRYVGGLTRVLSVDRHISFSELMVKLGEFCGYSVELRCQLPNGDLETLVSVKSEDELKNLIDEYDKSSPPGTKIRAVLSPPKSLKTVSPPPSSPSSTTTTTTTTTSSPLASYLDPRRRRSSSPPIGVLRHSGRVNSTFGCCHHRCCHRQRC